jgi:hypothetical protein
MFAFMSDHTPAPRATTPNSPAEPRPERFVARTAAIEAIKTTVAAWFDTAEDKEAVAAALAAQLGIPEAVMRARSSADLIRAFPPLPDGPSPEETEASEILDRVERELPSVEERINRLMYRYGL